ncbi:MAG: acetyl-CoA acetyltransferase [Chloroflexota bacterium]|nr:acetyl-CoA acetyltransferase [Chloroflexota bacterium]
MPKTYILGGYQSDFARNWRKEEHNLRDVMSEAVFGALDAVSMEPGDIDTAHVGNFAGELYSKQGQMGGFFAEISPDFGGLPTSRHEAACASGSISILMASAELEAERYGTALVLGVEQMKTVSPVEGGDFLGTAGWYELEAEGVELPFPKLFGRLGDVYDERYGLEAAHLQRLAELNYENAQRNPVAQTRKWLGDVPSDLDEGKYVAPITGRLLLRDCSQITDGAAALVLANEERAAEWAEARGIDLADVPTLQGWGHHTAALTFDEKIAQAQGDEYVLPHTRRAITDAYDRAGIDGHEDLDTIETHDCFTTSHYMAIDHFGITEPGKCYEAIEDGRIDFNGEIPMNPSGGLIGGGHPVGATGVRQALDAWKQVTGNAGDYQVEGASRAATLNIGGSGTTSVSLIIGR